MYFGAELFGFRSFYFCGKGSSRFASICNATISQPPSLPGFPGVAWRGALPSTPPELIHRAFGDSCAQQQSIVPGVFFTRVEAIRERKPLTGVQRLETSVGQFAGAVQASARLA